MATSSTQGIPHGMQQAHGPPPSQHFTEDEGGVLIGVTCMFLTLCLAVVGGRLVSRRMVKASLETDDYLAVGALLMYVALAIEQILIALSTGPGTIMDPIKLELASQFTYAFLITTARTSILMLYNRIFGLRTKWFRTAWYINLGLVLVYFIWLLIAFFLQCGGAPLSTLFRSPASCKTQAGVVGIAVAGFANAVIDTSILVLPVPVVWSLQMSYGRKWAISAMFSLGLIGVTVSMARAISVIHMNGRGFGFVIWSTAEAAIALICACLPSLRPLFTFCYTGIVSSIHGRGALKETTSLARVMSPTAREAILRDRRDKDKKPTMQETSWEYSRDSESQESFRHGEN